MQFVGTDWYVCMYVCIRVGARASGSAVICSYQRSMEGMQFVGTVWYVCMYVLELVRVLEAMLSSVRISGV